MSDSTIAVLIYAVGQLLGLVIIWTIEEFKK